MPFMCDEEHRLTETVDLAYAPILIVKWIQERCCRKFAENCLNSLVCLRCLARVTSVKLV